VGRSTQAETDAALTAEILTWSRSRGLFAGISLSGATLREDSDTNEDLYGKKVPNKDIVAGTTAAPKAACPHCKTCNNPPKFGDLNKKYKDLASDDFGFGAYKLTLKSKNAEGVNLKAEQSLKKSDGTLSTLLETKYTNAAHGLTYKGTWDHKNVVTSELTVEDKPIKGAKFIVTKACNGLTDWTNNWKLKAEYSNEKVTLEDTFNGTELTASAVVNAVYANIGASVTYDITKGALKGHTGAITHSCKSNFYSASIANGKDVAFSVVNTCSSGKHQTGAEVTYNIATGAYGINLASKNKIDDDLFLKFSVNSKFLVGAAFTQKVRQGISLTVGTQFDATNIGSDSQNIGAALTFEN